jgi:hypothetical protein
MCGPQPYRKGAFSVQLRAGHARPLQKHQIKKRTSAFLRADVLFALLYIPFMGYILKASLFTFFSKKVNQPGCLPM